MTIKDWIHDDITWCLSECDKKDCFRHISNRRMKTGIYTAAELKDTEYCPYKNETKVEVTLK